MRDKIQATEERHRVDKTDA